MNRSYYPRVLANTGRGRSEIEKRLKLFHSRPLNLGLQGYFNMSQISSLRLSGSEWGNLFAYKLRTGLKGLQCYAAETSAVQALLSQPKIGVALGKLVSLVQNLSSGRLVLVDEGVMIFLSKSQTRKCGTPCINSAQL